MSGVARLFDGHILDRSGREVNLHNAKYRGHIIALYFSAHWCPPCRAFTPYLNELYARYHQEKKVELIFISSDGDEKTFNEYFRTMPWLALDYKELKKREELFQNFQVTDIPKLVLLDGDSGKIICANAKEQILHYDPQGLYFPWEST